MSVSINYHHLQYFKVIAEEGSVSAAAAKIRVGQPTLSVQLKQLEEALGVQLFLRTGKRLVLTEHGRIALDYSRGIFRMGAELVEALHDRLRPLRPTLHVGALDCVPKQLVMRLTAAACALGPCQVTLSEGSQDELLRELSTHRIDLVLTNHLPSGIDAKGLQPKQVARNNVAFFGAARFKPLRRRFPRSLSGVPLILPTYESRLRGDLEHWAHNEGVELNILVESQDIAVKKLLAAEGLGLVPVGLHDDLSRLFSNKLFRIGALHGVHEEIYLLSAQRKILNPIASRLMATFQL